ncbi:MAG: GNAT family N-acetyltransferase [Lachnospiraceae bacterium]|nr:GNAT family N-acetyltransferase [Lachnospiraceae bacterium]
MFRVKVLNQLNGRQRGEVRELEDICREHDKIEGGISLTTEDVDEEKPVFVLCYEEELLAGFATMYRISESNAELCIYIRPEFRKRAMYKKLTTTLRKEVKKLNLENIYLVHEPRPKDDYAEILSSELFQYAYSEYMMEWKYSYALLPTNTLTVQSLTKDELDTAAELFAGAFLTDEEAARARITALMEENYRYYLVWQQKVPVGMFCLLSGEQTMYVFDFAVEADRQGRGIGKAMLKELIRLVQEEAEEQGTEPKKIQIQVGSRNGTAFRLYQKNGFQVVSQRDYYQVQMGVIEGETA